VPKSAYCQNERVGKGEAHRSIEFGVKISVATPLYHNRCESCTTCFRFMWTFFTPANQA
jgi:hypothetical protein